MDLERSTGASVEELRKSASAGPQDPTRHVVSVNHSGKAHYLSTTSARLRLCVLLPVIFMHSYQYLKTRLKYWAVSDGEGRRNDSGHNTSEFAAKSI